MISTTYIQQYKIILSTFLITILLIFPKINIFDINNYWQGIRFENLISLFLLILIISSPKKFKINDGYKFYLWMFNYSKYIYECLITVNLFMDV